MWSEFIFLFLWTSCLFLPDIEHIYMSEKKANHVKEKYDI